MVLEQLLIERIITAEDILSSVIIIICSFIGSGIQDIYAAYSCGRKISFIRVLLSTVTASVILIGFEPYIVDKIALRGLFGISVLLGFLGFEILQKISNIDGLIDLLRKALELIDLARGIRKPLPPPPTTIHEDIHIEINDRDHKKRK